MDKGAFSVADSFVEEFNDRVEQLSRLTNHPGSKGRFIELLLINLLRKYLPKKYDFSSGFYCSMMATLPTAFSMMQRSTQASYISAAGFTREGSS